MINPISIDWLREELKDFETFFVEELEEIRGYILQTALWLTSRPSQWEHVVTIWLNLESFPHEEDFFITIEVEHNKMIEIALHQVSLNENLDVDHYTVGHILMPPFESMCREEREELRKEIIGYLKKYKEIQD